jgi:dTMP kinase
VAYIAFEGGEGSGKSTQARLLAERLDAVLTREPGGTELGGRLRSVLLGTDQAPIGRRAETLLMAADRAQHRLEVIAPALAAGRHVVSDRSAYSSLAYQGGGRQLGVEAVRAINEWALDGCWPDVVVLLDLEHEAATARLDCDFDRIEQEDDAFHKRVRCTFLDLAADPAWVVVEGEGAVETVAERVWAAVGPRLAPMAGSR